MVQGTHVIPRDFRNIWCNLLNILNENNLIPLIFNKLIDTTNNVELENTIRETAALWISELLVGLQKAQLVNEELSNIEKVIIFYFIVFIIKFKLFLYPLS